MDSFSLILVYVLIGLLLRVFRIVPKDAARALNAIIIYVSLPALVLTHIHSMAEGSFSGSHLLVPVGAAWMLFLISIPFMRAFGKFLGWSAREIGALILTAGLANTSFVGFPLIEAFFGRDALQIAILVDQPGSFLSVSTVGVVVACYYANRKASWKGIFTKVILFPPMIALLAAAALRGWEYPALLKLILTKLGDILVPLALISVGLQLRLNPSFFRRYRSQLTIGLLFKLMLAPALIALTFLHWAGPQNLVYRVSIVEVAMPPMVTGAILATDYELEPELANMMVGIGIPLGLLTIPLWVFLTGQA